MNTQITGSADFYQIYRGSFTSVLKWPQLDEFWQRLKAMESGWYIYQVGETLPEDRVSQQQFEHFIDEIDSLLRQQHKEDYCGIVYADDLSKPAFIKIYDPDNLGVVCGFSDNPPLPGWIISRIKPQALDQNSFCTNSRKRWWQKLFP